MQCISLSFTFLVLRICSEMSWIVLCLSHSPAGGDLENKTIDIIPGVCQNKTFYNYSLTSTSIILHYMHTLKELFISLRKKMLSES